MWKVVVALIITFAILTILFCELADDYDRFVSGKRRILQFIGNLCLFMFCCSVVWGFVGFLGSLIVDHKLESEPYAVEKLVSLQDNNGYFVARYTVNNASNYIYMKDNGNGSYCQGSIKAEGVSVYYTAEQPRIEWYKSVGRCLGFKDSYDTPILYLPPGTILEQFSIDLK